MTKMAKQEPNPLSFYGSKMIFGQSKLFWSSTNHFGQVQKISPEKSNLNLTKTIWTVQNHFGPIERQGIEIGHF